MENFYIYKFTPDELRVVQKRYQEYLRVVGLIAEIHGIEGNLAVAPDASGFIRQQENNQ